MSSSKGDARATEEVGSDSASGPTLGSGSLDPEDLLLEATCPHYLQSGGLAKVCPGSQRHILAEEHGYLWQPTAPGRGSSSREVSTLSI